MARDRIKIPVDYILKRLEAEWPIRKIARAIRVDHKTISSRIKDSPVLLAAYQKNRYRKDLKPQRLYRRIYPDVYDYEHRSLSPENKWWRVFVMRDRDPLTIVPLPNGEHRMGQEMGKSISRKRFNEEYPKAISRNG